MWYENHTSERPGIPSSWRIALMQLQDYVRGFLGNLVWMGSIDKAGEVAEGHVVLKTRGSADEV